MLPWCVISTTQPGAPGRSWQCGDETVRRGGPNGPCGRGHRTFGNGPAGPGHPERCRRTVRVDGMHHPPVANRPAPHAGRFVFRRRSARDAAPAAGAASATPPGKDWPREIFGHLSLMVRPCGRSSGFSASDLSGSKSMMGRRAELPHVPEVTDRTGPTSRTDARNEPSCSAAAVIRLPRRAAVGRGSAPPDHGKRAKWSDGAPPHGPSGPRSRPRPLICD